MTTPNNVMIPVCWNHQTAVATISTEAVSPSPEVFFSTHVPLRIRRRHPDLRDSAGAEEISEEEVRRDFLTRKPVNGVLLMPVIGESGTGKSHLVRWIAERTKSDDRRAVVYVPKASTSLRALIRILLSRDDVDTTELRRLRDKIDDYVADIDEESLQRQLIGRMADFVAQADPGGDSYRRALVGPGKLALMLRDVHVQKRLMTPGALIPRLAASLLSDRADGEDDRPTEFQVGDLPEITTIEDAAFEVRKLLKQLIGAPKLQVAAAELLTEALSPAVQSVFGMGGGQLQEAMLTIRREYLAQGKEIVLLIEDFAVIQGVQRDLLDALIEAGVREGRQVLAPVRTLMAVTTGYYRRLADTVITRVQSATPYVYDLDIDFKDSDRARADTMEFVGRYFNAARIGVDALKAAGVATGEPVPNKCDTCEFQQPCHNAFGVSPGGFGIFPLNWPALRRAIRARPVPGDRPDAFNPRITIGQVISPVLEEAQAISDGRFPDDRFKAMFPLVDDENPLKAEVQVAINELDAANADRRAILLEYWGDAPDRVVNLEPAIHATFQLPLLNNTETRTAFDRGGRDGKIDRPISDRNNQQGQSKRDDDLPPAVRRDIEAVDAWAAGREPLSQNTAGIIRRIIRQAVINRCQWNNPLTAEPDATMKNTAWPAKSTTVSIENAAAENLPGTADAPIRFKCTPENAVFFKGLLRASAGVPGPHNGQALRRLAEYAERYAPALEHEVVRVRQSSDDALNAWFSASLLGASLCGRAWPGMPEDQLIDVVFDDGRSWELQDAAFRIDPWLKIYHEHRQARPGMVEELRRIVGIQRGLTGVPRLIDAARVVPIIRSVASTWLWQPQGQVPPKLRPAVSGLTQISQLADMQVRQLKEINEVLANLLPEGTSGPETVRVVESAFEQAQGVNLGPTNVTDSTQFRLQVKALREADWRSVAKLRKDIEAVDRAADDSARRFALLNAAAVDRGADLPAIVDFLSVCDEWFTARLDEQRRQSGVGDAAAEKVAALIARWRRIVGAQ